MTADQNVIEDVAAKSLPSDQISVGKFECVLLLPVFLQWQRKDDKTIRPKDADPEQNPDFLDIWIQQITGESSNNRHWKVLETAYPPLTGSEAQAAYSEFCYFHPFVRNFLYVNRDDLRQQWKAIDKFDRPNGNDIPTWDEFIAKTKNRNLRMLKRDDLAQAELIVDYEQTPTAESHVWQDVRTTFTISTCWMYLFDTQVAMVSLRLVESQTAVVRDNGTIEPCDLNLRQVLRLQDQLRRSYATYWSVFPDAKSGLSKHQAGHCPKSLTLRFKDDERPPVISTFGTFSSQTVNTEELTQATQFEMLASEPVETATARSEADSHRKHVFLHREPFVIPLWSEILSPLVPTQFEHAPGPKHSKLHFELIEDERIPIMSFIAVGQPRSISTADWIRIAFADDEGDSQIFPYSPEFQSGEMLRSVAYDRFWHSTGEAKSGANKTLHHVRWLCCGYAFVGVGPSSDDIFFMNEHSGALTHFRHHYFALAMIAQFHRASLLRFKHELAEASDELLDAGGGSRILAWLGHHDHESRMIKFRKRVQSLAERLERFRARYWFVEVSNQIQGQELFDLYKKHLNLETLLAAISADAQAAEQLVSSWHEEHRNRSTHSLALLGALAIPLIPLIDYCKSDLWVNHPNRFSCLAWLSIIIFGVIFQFVPLLYNRYAGSRRLVGAAMILGGIVALFGYNYETVRMWCLSCWATQP